MAVVAVFALHVCLSYVAYRLRAAVFEREAPSDHALRWVQVHPMQSRAQRNDRTDTHRGAPQEIARPRQTRALEDSPAIEASLPSLPSPINWRANAARSAQVVVEESMQEGHRSFGPREQPDLDARAPESVFGPAPKHMPGEVGEDTYGDPALWLNDSCYQELEKPVQTARDVFTIVPLVKCVMSIGKREANGKLFEHLKKREEPPVPRAGTELNELPEREEETLRK
jgi:hypothetical protein